MPRQAALGLCPPTPYRQRRLLTTRQTGTMIRRTVLITPTSKRQVAPSARFFFAHGLINGRECDGYKTRKGKKSAQLAMGYQLLPTPADNGAPRLSKEHTMTTIKLPRKTRFTKFFSCNPQQDSLFAINGDLDVDDALEQALCFLEASEHTLRDLCMSASSRANPINQAWPSLYLVEISRAIVLAALSAIRREERGHA